MNVSESNSITNMIKTLRENVYETSAFKDMFAMRLRNVLNIDQISYLAEPLGGWSIDIIMTEPSYQESSKYIQVVSDVLIDILKEVKHFNIDKALGSCLINVIMTGPKSLIISL